MDKQGERASPLLVSPSTTTVPMSPNFPEQLRVWQETLIAAWREAVQRFYGAVHHFTALNYDRVSGA